VIIHFFQNLSEYLKEITPSLLGGFLLSGLLHEFIPQTLISRYLNQRGLKPILWTTITGMILPLCCFGSLPIAVALRKKGVSLGPILAFLVTTPATSVTAILVTLRLLGFGFCIYLCLSVIFMGLTIGLIGNVLPFKRVSSSSSTCPMCHEGKHNNHQHHQKGLKSRVTSVLSFGFIDLPKDIGLELLIGLLLAAVVVTVTPLGNLIKEYLQAGMSYLFALIFGLIMYICSTGSVPLVHAFTTQGLALGAGMVLLLLGPITSYGTILVVRKEFGGKILLLYLATICGLSLLLGYLFTFFKFFKHTPFAG
jgi:hypothetical protein